MVDGVPYSARSRPPPSLEACGLPLLDECLSVTQDDATNFIGYAISGYPGRAFGGHLAALGVLAAGHDVPADRYLNSVHIYFLAAARSGQPLRFAVTRLRDGKGFLTRRVDAYDGDTMCFTMICSFCRLNPSPEFGSTGLHVSGPEKLEQVLSLSSTSSGEAYRGFDIRPVGAINFSSEPTAPPLQTFWIRCESSLTGGPLQQAAALAYLSDLGLAPVGGQPLRMTGSRVAGTSLDHAVWFHRPAQVHDWLLVQQESPSYVHGRAICRSTIWLADGRLVASCMQEALLRRVESS